MHSLYLINLGRIRCVYRFQITLHLYIRTTFKEENCHCIPIITTLETEHILSKIAFSWVKFLRYSMKWLSPLKNSKWSEEKDIPSLKYSPGILDLVMLSRVKQIALDAQCPVLTRQLTHSKKLNVILTLYSATRSNNPWTHLNTNIQIHLLLSRTVENTNRQEALFKVA